MSEPLAKDAARRMRKELAELEADQAKATCWGAAVGERGKRIEALRRKLARQPDTSADAVERIEQSSKRQHFTDVRHVTVRWEPYKPDGARQMKRKGRWQEQVGIGDYWRWQNCERPAFAHDPDAEAERDALQDKLDDAVGVLQICCDFMEYGTWPDRDPVVLAQATIAKLKGSDR